MRKKIITYLLLFSTLNTVGCYSNVTISANEYFDSNLKKTIDVQYDGGNVKLEPGQYFIMHDTLYWSDTGKSNHTNSKKKIALDKIQKIEYEEYDETKTCITGGILGLFVVVITILALGSTSFNPYN